MGHMPDNEKTSPVLAPLARIRFEGAVVARAEVDDFDAQLFCVHHQGDAHRASPVQSGVAGELAHDQHGGARVLLRQTP